MKPQLLLLPAEGDYFGKPEFMSKKHRRIYVVDNQYRYANWMQGNHSIAMDKDVDLVVFTGGEDVCPELYGVAERHPKTSCCPPRDWKEVLQFERAMDPKLPMVGICRGAQFLCVMAGGKLVQDQPNPNYLHEMETADGKFTVTSTHHQAQYPWGLPADSFKILGWTKELLNYHQAGDLKEMTPPGGVEVEVCFYPKINALCIQPHPEMMYKSAIGDRAAMDKAVTWFRAQLNLLLGGGL